MENNPATTKNNNIDNSVGIIAYITLIGFIIAIVLNNDKKGETKAFGAFHLRQSLGLVIIALIVGLVLGILTPILFFLTFLIWPLFNIGIIILMIFGIVNAVNGVKKPLPLIGKFIDEKLGKAFE